MNHKKYTGKQLKELIKATPSYAINFYEVSYDEKIYHLSEMINDENCINKTIKSISNLASDYTYWIQLED